MQARLIRPLPLARPRRIRRRAALGLLLSTGMVTLVAACVGAPSAANPTVQQPTTAPLTGSTPPAAAGATTASTLTSSSPTAPAGQTQPKRGGTLRTALTPDLANLEVHYILINQYENLWLTMDRLITYDDKLVPAAATGGKLGSEQRRKTAQTQSPQERPVSHRSRVHQR